MQGDLQALARTFAGSAGTWNEDILAALRLKFLLPNASLSECLANIPGGIAELFRNPTTYLT